MTQPVFTTPTPLQALLRSMADTIEATFTPAAFTCNCNGLDPSCRKVIETDRWAMSQADTTRRIAEYVRRVADGRKL